jgi:hypothetical protein
MRRRVWIVNVEVGVDALTGLSAQLTHALAASEDFPSNGGSQESHRAVLLREFRLKLARLSQLCVDVGATRR